MPACLYAKCDPTYYAPTTHQLRATYASYTRSTHTFKLQYAYYDIFSLQNVKFFMSPTVHRLINILTQKGLNYQLLWDLLSMKLSANLFTYT